ncbi:hypothetical protein FRC00_007588 [Tulasnella sp. 408]|nr:hypothetical protein FRC00_007588 [Tulasnella sp. 408]
MSAINIPVSLPSPSASSNTSASPIAPATPLTPNSGHHVTFANNALPHGGGAEQFNFDALNLTAKNAVTAPTTGTAAANASTNGGPVRRKTSRRANTAERRATHNAVERQRRETLNGRFLDLAALLPNLASVRRPSKSAIVNSSIALVHTMRRSRATSARELRLLKLEADALRAEVNQWRERAGMGLTPVEEPARSRDFEELVSGGLEEDAEGLLEEERRALEIVKEGLNADFYDDEDSSDNQGPFTRPGSQGSIHGIPSVNVPVALPLQNTVSNPGIFDPSEALLQSHPTHNAGINAYNAYDFNTHSLGLTGMPPAKGANQWQSGLFTPQQTYVQPTSFAPSPSTASFLGGFGLRTDDDASSNSDVGSVVGFDLNQVNIVPGLAQHRSRSSSSLSNLQTAGLKGAGSPPTSAPATAATYADSASAGDAFAAAYNAAFPSAVPAVGRVPGGGNAYGAAMGLFM